MSSPVRKYWILLMWLTLWTSPACDVAVSLDGDRATFTGYTSGTDSDPAENEFPPGCPAYYEVVPLGTLGGELAVANGISDLGWVVGHSEHEMASRSTRPFIWIPTEDNGKVGTMNALGSHELTGFTPLDLFAINDRGEAVGYGSVADSGGQGGEAPAAFFWSEDDGIVLLEGIRAEGISNSGLVVGGARYVDGERLYDSAYIWSKEDGYSWLPPVPGAPENAGVDVNDINDGGVAAGVAFDGLFRGHAVKYTLAGGYSKLPDYGSARAPGARANAINNNGQIVGSAVTVLDAAGTGFSRPTLWEANGTMWDLGLLAEPAGIANGEALDINDDGLIVGADDGRAWLWCGGSKRTLNELIDSEDDWYFHSASGINNRGQIVAGGTHHGSPELAAVLFPVFDDTDIDE